MSRGTIDKGHGGKDPGAIGNGIKEKDITLMVGNDVVKILREHGVSITETRVIDKYVDLKVRSDISNKTNSDFFVSIHVNSFKDTKVNGLETFHFPNSIKGKKLAVAIHSQLVNDRIFKINRGVKTANFSVLRETKAPACLVELGFISNKGDVDILLRRNKDIAVSIAKGILEYLNIKYIPPKYNDNDIYYRVVTGSFKNKNEAIKRQDELKKKGYDSFLLPYKK